ncbi:multicopper oxidase domain-containing protein [Nitrosopumilus piranensis]|uniref:Plastocyanin-like domain-containing protein n=1 Tax=Nitrosopumilus piranensis TaxID=1582439 RepID=A0A0C5C8R3_9ARCH|nr:multicopper oxidase domain-containing protein [Nitrosopumilus piranensis]AJM91592.1 exported protein of unknown function [Nitrosopumilus piranensis]
MKFLNSLGGKIILGIAFLFVLSFSINYAFPTQDIQTQTLVTNVKNIQTTGDIIDPINYGNLFNYNPAVTQNEHSSFTDVVTMSQGDRGIIEFEYDNPGKYLFHAHKTELSEKGG